MGAQGPDLVAALLSSPLLSFLGVGSRRSEVGLLLPRSHFPPTFPNRPSPRGKSGKMGKWENPFRAASSDLSPRGTFTIDDTGWLATGSPKGATGVVHLAPLQLDDNSWEWA